MYNNIKFLTDSAELNLSEIARITNIDGLGAVTAAINTTQIGLNPAHGLTRPMSITETSLLSSM